MQEYNLQIGDMIRVDRPLYRHVGIYVGQRAFDPRDVIHNDKGGGVVLSTLADFSAGSAVFIHQPAAGDIFEREAIVQRAFSLLGIKFDLLAFNCEHAATFAQSGKSESPQLQAFAVVALLFGGLAILASKG
jgi:hypothetical protein